MNAFFKSFWREETGATLVEYGLLTSLLAIAALVGLGQLSVSVKDAWAEIHACVDPVDVGTLCPTN